MIEITQSHKVAAPEGQVAAALLDPDILRSAIPGCKNVRRVSDGIFWALATVNLLAMKFDVDATLTVAPVGKGYRISGPVRVGPLNAGTVESNVTLTQSGEVTVVDSRTTIRPARNHSRFVLKAATMLARQLSDTFFTRLAEQVREAA